MCVRSMRICVYVGVGVMWVWVWARGRVSRQRDITYIPSHLYHIVFELLKNSCRAVTELHDNSNTIHMPPVEVLIIKVLLSQNFRVHCLHI